MAATARRARSVLGAVLTGALLLPIPAWAALSFTWTSGPTSGNPGLVGVALDPTDATGATVLFTPNLAGNSKGATFTITGTANVTQTGGGNINVVFDNWNAFKITGGTLKVQATYNNQVLFNPERLFNTGQQPPNQFKGIGQGLSNQPQQATFTITFTSTTWQTQPISPVRLTFYQN